MSDAYLVAEIDYEEFKTGEYYPPGFTHYSSSVGMELFEVELCD